LTTQPTRTPQVAYFVEPNFGENAYVVSLGASSPCWIVDPGLPPSAEQILDHIADLRLTPDAIVLTHAHADHIAGIPEVLEAFPELPVYLADEEAEMLENAALNLSSAFGAGFVAPVRTRRPLAHGDTLRLGETEWPVIDTSGHSPGGRTLHCPAASMALVGDAIFAEGIGRYDFPTSDGETLFRNIRERLMTLPSETMVYSGHGPRATIGWIAKHNPMVRDVLAGRMD